MNAFVRFWGTRGSIPTPGHATRRYGGNTSCVEIRIDEALFVCDGGTGLRELGLELMSRAQGASVEAHLFFSHTHWDHIQGFPFFTPAYVPGTRLYVYDVDASDARVHRLLRGQMREDYFPVSFSELGSVIASAHLAGGEKQLDGVLVRAFEQHHPGRSFAYSFEKGGKKIVYATDNELDMLVHNRDDIIARPHELRRAPEAFLRFIAEADLLIADGQYLDEEYPQRVGWGHARATTLVDAAILGRVKQLAVFHHDPMHSDDQVDRKILVCRERAKGLGASGLSVFAAREGLELRI